MQKDVHHNIIHKNEEKEDLWAISSKWEWLEKLCSHAIIIYIASKLTHAEMFELNQKTLRLNC